MATMKNGLHIDQFSNKKYYKDDLLHREDGPALEYSHGHKEWYIYGKLHREDGPAIEYPDGYKAWCLNGEIIIDCKTNEKFLKIVKYMWML